MRENPINEARQPSQTNKIYKKNCSRKSRQSKQGKSAYQLKKKLLGKKENKRIKRKKQFN